MNFDNAIKIAFIISVFFHSILIFGWPAISKFIPRRPINQFEITYYRIKALESSQEKKISIKQPLAVKKNPPLASPSKMAQPKTQAQRQRLKAAQAKAQQIQKSIETQKKTDMVIPPVPAGIEKIPAYLDYVQSVREKIKKTANRKYNPSYPTGEVFLNFVLYSDGSLAIVKIIDGRSSGDETLKKIAQESIEDASPFEIFPPDLDFKQLSFSVVISFE